MVVVLDNILLSLHDWLIACLGLIPSEGWKRSVCPCSGTVVAVVSKNARVLLEPTRDEVPRDRRPVTFPDGSNLPMLEFGQRCWAESLFPPAWQGRAVFGH